MTREMKNSGIQWIGDIPKSWKISKMQYIANYYNGYAFKPTDWCDAGLQIVRIQDLTGSNDSPNYYDGILPDRYRIRKGDILISWAATLNSFIWEKDDAWLNQHIFKTKPHTEIITKHFFYWLTQVAMYNMNNANKHGIMMQHVTANVFNKFPLPLPPLSEQRAIAEFLDKKCEEIDGLLTDLDTEVKTLTEYKKSIIAETVTHGLNPNAPMKQSDIPWADLIPEHWEIMKGKFAVRLLQRPVKEDDGVVTCFRDGEVTLRSNRREEGFTMSAKEYGYQGIEPGDLVVHGMDGFAGAIGISDSRGKGTPVLNVLESDYNKRYLMYYLRNMAYGDVFLALSTGIRVRSCDLGWKKLAEIRFIIPTIEEQNAIASYLDEKCSLIDKAIADKQAQMETLKSYKASFIYEYVTGKKQVI